MKTKNLKFGTLISLLIFFSVGFYSCKDDPDEDTSGISTQDRDFATKASAANISEIQFGQLAGQKATNDSVSLFARRMIEDHTKAQRSLDSIGKSMNVTLSDSLDRPHRLLYTDLSRLSGAAFDSAYIHNQVIDHQNTRDLLQKEIDNGNDTRLKDYARKQLPVVVMHHEEALRLRTSLSGKP